MDMHNKKIEQILDGATSVFREYGYEGTSIDMIVHEAGVSKATVYKYFEAKNDIFRMVVERQCEKHAAGLKTLSVDGEDAHTILRHIADKIVRIFSSEFLVDLFRITAAEAGRQPEIGKIFYDAGPQTGLNMIARVLEILRQTGQLKIDDTQLAARQFKELCKAEVFLVTVFNVQSKFSKAEYERFAENAVKTFLAIYAQPSDVKPEITSGLDLHTPQKSV